MERKYQPASGQTESDAIKHWNTLERRVKSPGYTNGYTEYVGIDKISDGCNFEIEVLARANETPKVRYYTHSDSMCDTNFILKLQFNVPYIIYNPGFDTYLTADTSGTYDNRFFGFVFYAKKSRARKFMFRKFRSRGTNGDIANDLEVELTLCDESGEPIAVVHRYSGDGSTLMVSKYGVEHTEDFSVPNNCKVQYQT